MPTSILTEIGNIWLNNKPWNRRFALSIASQGLRMLGTGVGCWGSWVPADGSCPGGPLIALLFVTVPLGKKSFILQLGDGKEDYSRYRSGGGGCHGGLPGAGGSAAGSGGGDCHRWQRRASAVDAKCAGDYRTA